MGFDRTLHVIDDKIIRARFVPQLLGRSGDRSPFDETPDAEELWTQVGDALAQMQRGEVSPGSVASLICQLAIVS